MRMSYVIITFLFIACGPTPLSTGRLPATGESIQGLNQCGCDFEHAPACSDDGETFINECIARCHGVESFGPKACACDPNSGPLCGQPPMVCEGEVCAQVMPAPKTYESECAMVADDATLRNLGECPSSF